MFDPKVFFDLVDPNKNIIVAFSGGGDSSALLHFCYELNQQGLLQGHLSAIHINHSLSKYSDSWEDHCKIFCRERNIDYQSCVVNINIKIVALKFTYISIKVKPNKIIISVRSMLNWLILWAKFWVETIFLVSSDELDFRWNK